MVIKRRRSIDPSQVEDCLRQYFNLNPAIVRRRWHYPLIKVLDFMRNELGLQSVADLLKCDAKQLAIALQAWVAKRAGEASAKTIRFETYLVRSFFAHYDVEIPLRKIKMPRKAGRTRIDRLPSIADLQRLVSGAKSPRMRLAIMMMCLTGMRLNECLNVRREHIDLERGFITIPPENTKTGRGREVPIPSELKEELKQYLEKHYPFERGFLFCVKNNPEKRIHVARFYDKYVKLLRRLGLDEKTPDGSAYRLHPHVFRKWYRTQLEVAGVNKLLIDMWVGHNSGAVERLYYLPTPDMIREEVEKADKALRIFGHVIEPRREEEREAEINLLWSALWSIAETMAEQNPKLLRQLQNLGVCFGRATGPEGNYSVMLLKRGLLRRQP
jgi:integrase/recombinase XerD